MNDLILQKDEDELKTFSKFLGELQKETDRAAAIVAASMLDQKLKTVLLAYLIEGESTKNLLEGMNSPIRTFGSRIDLTHSLGLISDYEYNECHIIRKIRNDFAHKFQLEFSFKDPKISNLCFKLESHIPGERIKFKDKPRDLFENAVMRLSLNWMWREKYLKSYRLERRDWEEITSKVWENPSFATE